MKKKLLAMLLSAAMVLSLAACGGGDDNKGNDGGSSNDNPPAASSNDDQGSAPATGNDDQGSAPADIDYGSGVITIWVAENVTEFTQQKADEFFAAHPEMAGYTVDIQPTGEGDAAGNIITDVEGGADIYGFAQDQLGRLVSAGALTPITGDYASFVESENDAGAVGAAKMGNQIYAFPLTSDNGYFLFYDKSVVTDPTNLDQILADCAAAGKNFYMEINSGWYQTAFFFGTGCTLTYDTDDSGALVSSNITYATDNGVKALKAMIALASNSVFVNGSSLSSATNVGAIIDGTWDAGAAKDLLGENYACAKLPSFTVDGETFQMGGFGGFKLLGVKPQTEQGKMLVCLALAQYLTNAETQTARFEAVGWGPSNLTAQSSEAVQADEALAALAAQLAFAIPQGQYPDAYWQDATSLGDDVIAGNYNNMSDDELMNVLQGFQELEQSYAGQ
ncbi:MAG: extracellular solute-binding protein [Lachnospiraceae bacterium]|nr:extracellular solute-binding protein [Lachnospiraceae bacterium]MBD5483754.1 extracellular solute-binding protein [Lachnospiraceae bacterium]